MTTPPNDATAPRGARILIVDDDQVLLATLERTLRREGYEVLTSSDPGQALELARGEKPDLVLTDLMMPGMDGIELLERIRRAGAGPEVLLITGHASVERAVEAMRLGAYDFIEKPVERERLLRVVAKALEKHSLAAENLRLRERLAAREGDATLVGTSEAMTELRRRVAEVAPSEVAVLITGESGTGKERVADLLHRLSGRRGGPFVKISCAAIPENLLESELFGYERGAFSGAAQSKAGRFELADGGTLLLDEIGDMPVNMQAKLLRVLQDGTVQRLGGTRDVRFDARLVCATNVDIGRAIDEKRFRADLYHRINVIELEVPPLRERLLDLPILADHFLKFYAKGEVKGVSRDALESLTRHDWPGNVRELENVIQRALVTARGPEIQPEDIRFAAAYRPPAAAVPPVSGDRISIPVTATLAEAEELVVEHALHRTGGDKEKAARLLGVSSRTLYRRARRPEDEP